MDDDLLEEIADFALTRYQAGERIDWDDLLYRIEDRFDIDLGMDMLSVDIKAIKRAIAKARKEANQ